MTLSMVALSNPPKSQSARGRHHWRSARNLMVALAALAAAGCFSSASLAIEIVAVEEYWELSLGEPDAATSSPQVCMVMGAYQSLDEGYFVFTLNHHSYPEWAAGGLQVQRWSADEVAAFKSAPDEGTLHHANEKVSWVQRLSLSNGLLSFEVTGGTSQSWGSFGEEGELRLVNETSLQNLNRYRPAVSLGESGVAFAGNRVKSLVLTKLRWIDSEGNAYELTAPIDVDADLDP